MAHFFNFVLVLIQFRNVAGKAKIKSVLLPIPNGK